MTKVIVPEMRTESPEFGFSLAERTDASVELVLTAGIRAYVGPYRQAAGAGCFALQSSTAPPQKGKL